MPRPRQIDRQAPSFTVSPWCDKKRDDITKVPQQAQHATAAGTAAGADSETPLYSVVVGDCTAASHSAQHASAAGSDPHTAIVQHSTPSGKPTASDAVPWRSIKKRRVTGAEAVSYAAACDLDESAIPPDSTPTSGYGAASQKHERSPAGDAAAAEAGHADAEGRPKEHAVHGVAHLALLPSGALSGHFVGAGGGRACLGIVGRQVLAERTCYRDTEWALLQLTITHLGRAAAASTSTTTGSRGHSPDNRSSDDDTPMERVAWVQRTGGDLACLEPADPDDEATEPALLAESLGLAPDTSVSVTFKATQLLCDKAAEVHLAKYSHNLCGRGALVNVGHMSIEGLPPDWLY